MFPSLPIEDNYITVQVYSTLTPRWAQWLNSTNTLHRGFWQVTTPVLQDKGRRLTNQLYFVLKLTMIFFTLPNTTDHSAVCTTFHNCVNLIPHWLVHVTSSAKGHSMQSLLEKPTSIRSAYLYHTHMHMALCMSTCSCMPTTLFPTPPPPPPSLYNLIVYPNVCMPVCPDVCLLPGLA